MILAKAGNSCEIISHKKADVYNEIPSALLKPFIEEYYCRYHSNKTMEYVCSDM